MGSKSSNVPAPDPRLVEAQIKSMGIQDDVIQKIMQQSDEVQPLQKEQLQFGLDSARTAYDALAETSEPVTAAMDEPKAGLVRPSEGSRFTWSGRLKWERR